MPPDRSRPDKTGERFLASRAVHVVARGAARASARTGLVWGLALGVFVTAQAAGYRSTYPGLAARRALVGLFGHDRGLAALVGPARDLTTVAGFVQWKSLVVVAVLGSVAGLLVSTRLLRGEEDLGRYELLLGAPLSRRSVAAASLVGLLAEPVGMWAGAAAVLALVARPSVLGVGLVPAAYFALVPASCCAFFVALGALTSQLAPNRRLAASLAGAGLALSYALRLVADSRAGLAGLSWTSPLGWAEELDPLLHARAPVLLAPVLATAALGALAVALASTRDVGSAVLAGRRHHRRPACTGTLRLEVRLLAPAALAWGAGAAAFGALAGYAASLAAPAVAESGELRRVLARLGASGSGEAPYLGFAFVIVSALASAAAVGFVAGARDEEASGRLEHLLAGPLRRSRWLAGRSALAGVTLVLVCLAASVATMWGSSGIGALALASAGLNAAAPALAVLGAGTLALGVTPRAAVPAAAALLVWSLLLELVGAAVGVDEALLDTSVFHLVSTAPAVATRWQSVSALATGAALAAGAGAAAFSRRDVRAR